MNWQNLKENKCPKCDKTFGSMSFKQTGVIKCFHPEQLCDFAIREFRYQQIVNCQITEELKDKWDKEMRGGE